MSELTLGITTIGDLLENETITRKIPENDNEASTKITPVSLKIPDYQRPYKWEVKNAIRLLDDIEEARRSNKDVYRVGTLILHKEKDKNEYNIVDGQQRVITFSLLLKCLLEKDGTQTKDQTGANPEPQPEPKPPFKFLERSLKDNDDNKRNVYQNYQAFKRRISSLKEGAKSDLKQYVEENCELVVIITDDISEAFQFFDSQNARGKKLYPHDLLKAYHLREMRDSTEDEINKSVEKWESIDQGKLAGLFDDLYRLKEWIKGDEPDEFLSEKNLDIFKGITAQDNYPYASFYKSAYAYIKTANGTYSPFVTGSGKMNLFQINAPVIAGQPFFEYAKHYYDLLTDIRDNSKYVGYFVNDNKIVATLNKAYKYGSGNERTRLLFDIAILLYVDRYCHNVPSRSELANLEKFIVYAFIWAYSLRLLSSRIYERTMLLFVEGNKKRNSFNLYRVIANAPTPIDLFTKLEDMIKPIICNRGDEKNTDEEIWLNSTVYDEIFEKTRKDKKYKTIHEWFIKYGYLKTKTEK